MEKPLQICRAEKKSLSSEANPGLPDKIDKKQVDKKGGGWDGVGRETNLFLKFLAMYVYFPVPSFKQKKEMVFLPINRPNTGVFDIFSCCALENAV